MSEPTQPLDVVKSAVLERLRHPYEAVMLFGSVARQMSSQDSDIDVLQLVATPRPSYKDGRLSVSVYSRAALREMAIQGNLFALHLKLEGRVIFDPKGLLVGCLSCYREVDGYDALFRDLLELSRFLDVPPEEYNLRAASLNQLAVFVLRSALFAILAAQRRPQFAMTRVAECLGDAAISRAYALKGVESADPDLFAEAKRLIERYLKCEIKNPCGSYEALLLNSSRKSEFVRSVALHFLKRFSDEGAYDFFKHQLDGKERHRR